MFRIPFLLCCSALAAIAAPNLVITDFGFAQDPPMESQRLTFRATLTNTGDEATPKSMTHSVTFYLVGPEGKRRSLTYGAAFKGPLAPGKSVEVTAEGPWRSAKPGKFTFAAMADDVNRIPESDEKDNTLQKEITLVANPEALREIAEHPAPKPLPASLMDLIPNGDFSLKNPDGSPAGWKDQTFIPYGPATVVDLGKNLTFEWDARARTIWEADYVFSYDIKMTDASVPGNPGAGIRAVLWPRLPDQHEPPAGPINGKILTGTHDWTHVEIPLRMPSGVRRFLTFFDYPQGMTGQVLITNLSLRPVNPTPLLLDDKVLFSDSPLEQMLWIWSKPGFHFEGATVSTTTTLVLGGHMGKAMREPAKSASAWFRRTFSLPEGAKDAQVVFVGDDSAELFLDGKRLGSNHIWQDVARVLLPVNAAQPHEILFKVQNAFGLAGLLGRVDWVNADGSRGTLPTNARWETSDDEGKTWRPASLVAAPAPALSAFEWIFPHLPQQHFRLSTALPEGVTSARFLGLSPNSFRLEADGASLGDFESAGAPLAIDLGDRLNGKGRLTVDFRETGLQPPAGNGVLELQIGDTLKLIPVGAFQTAEGKPPEVASIFTSTETWPISQIAFEAAASRPIIPSEYVREKWVLDALDGANLLWQIGTPDGSSKEFAPIDAPVTEVTLETPTSEIPRGLELLKHPSLSIAFQLPKVPLQGAAFVVDVEDADAVSSQCAVFVNGTMTGLLQLSGYDQFPGDRLTQRAWVVTLEPERLRVGKNVVALRMLPEYYITQDKEVANQSEEYIRQLDLGDRARNPLPSASWFQWDAISLYALPAPPASPINGRPAWMGTNGGTYLKQPVTDWKSWILRDLQYMGFTGIDAPMRFGVWTPNQLADLQKTDDLPDGQTRGDFVFQSLLDLGIRPYANFEPGRGIRTPEEMTTSNEAAVVRQYGKYFNILEIGNEVDHPFYGFDRFSLGIAAATIQKESSAGRFLTNLNPDHPLQLMGQGWYHAWDFSTLDAQARQEAENDPGFTEALSCHSYGMSYIICSTAYASLYGPTLGDKPIYVTECGAWTPNDDIVAPFDRNMRGNLSFASHIVQYVLHPYTMGAHPRFCLLSSQDADAKILEKGRCYRRYVLGYGVKGTPLPWQHQADTLTNEAPVLVRAVDAGKWWKIALINFGNKPQRAALNVTLPLSGTFEALRFGDGPTVAKATRSLAITADPSINFDESLAPGEAIEYLISKPLLLENAETSSKSLDNPSVIN